MTQYNTLNIKLSNSQLNKLKSGMKKWHWSDFENFIKYCCNIKLSKTQVHKIGQSGGFLGRLLGPLLKTVLPLKENVLKPLAKRVLIPLGSTAAASVIDVAIHKKMFGSGNAILIISNK